MMKAFAAAAVGGVLVWAVPAPARANVIYTFTPTTVTRTPPLPVPTLGAGFTLELTDGAFADGGFDLIGRSGTASGFDPVYTGDVGEFVRFNVGGEGPTATPTSLFGSLDLSLTFSASGDVVSGRVVTQGRDTALDLGISGNVVSGYFGSDEPSCNAPVTARVCFESGPLTRTNIPSDVPEPGSLALLGVGALGVGAAARRRRGTVAA